MFHPIGTQPPQVYWRRRLLFAASLVLCLLLIVLTVNALTSGGGDPASAASGASPSRTVATPTTPVPRSTARAATTKPSSSSSAARSSSSTPAAATHSSSAVPPPACDAKELTVAAVPQRSSYRIGDRPVLQLRVTDTGPTPCVQDLGDKQVELKVYNGESRVWGSHDCKVVPGSTPRTLAPNVPVLVALSWSGLSSQSPCTGTRQRVGVGTYTLYGSLAGRTGTAGRFTIS